MNKKEVEIGIVEIVLVALVIVAIYNYIEPSYTGYGVYTGSKEITFTNTEDFTYNDSLIQIIDGEISLLQQEINSSWTTYEYPDFTPITAYYDYSDKTSKVEELDSQYHSVIKNKIFDITFLEFLNNGDTITIYTKSSNPNIIKLCKASTICNENNLGTII
ncbi:MAG: hypothetical protein KKG75_02630, partial [Nanoarchaeota archaeon]|nr:hypothetical protein [Nanoarchaeota archaeon]